MIWRYKPGRTLSCPFEHDNPEPEPDWSLYENAEDWERPDWTPTIQCHRAVAFRVIFVDGTFADCCEPSGHGAAMVFWAAPLYCHPVFKGDFERVMKYFYRSDDLVALEAREHPFFALMGAR